jgi:hypothetical protein
MPAKSKAQKTAMCMALAARKGDLEVSKLKGAALEIYNSDMTNKEIEEFTVMESLQNYINKNMKNLTDTINESLVNEMGPIIFPAVPNLPGGLSTWIYVVFILLELAPVIWLLGDAFVMPKVEELLHNYNFNKLKKELEDVPEFQNWMSTKNRRLKDLITIINNLDSKHYKNAKSAAQQIWDEIKDDTKIR